MTDKAKPNAKAGQWLNDWTWQDARGIQYIGSTIPKHAMKSKPPIAKDADSEAAAYEAEFNAAGISAHEDELLVAIERKTKRPDKETRYQFKTRILRGYIAQRAKLNGKPKKAASDSPLAISADRVCRVGLPGTGPCQMNAGHQGEHLLIDGTRVFTWTNDRDRNDWVICGTSSKDRRHKCMRPYEHDNEHMALTVTKSGASQVVQLAWWPDGGETKIVGASQPAKCLMTFTDLDGPAKSAPAKPAKAKKRCLVHNAGGEQCVLDMKHDSRHSNGETEFDAIGTVNTDPRGDKALKRAAKQPLESAKGNAVGTKICGYRSHRAAARFDMLPKDELDALAGDIKRNGQKHKIVLIEYPDETLILDGRNRGAACELAGVKPEFEYYTSPDRDWESLKKYVDSMNERRRHLSAGQRAALAAEDATLPNGQRQVGKFAEVPTQKEAAEQRAVSERAVRQAVEVKRKGAPEVFAALRAGKMTPDVAAQLVDLPKAKQRELVKTLPAEAKSGHVRSIVRQEKKRETAKKIEAERTPLPVGPFRVIMADCPWRYDNSDGHAGSRGHTDYPTMSVDELCALGPEVIKLAHEDAILWFCATNAHLVDGSASCVVAAWGFHGITALTWKKNKLGMGSWLRNQTEHIILAVRGKPTFVNTTLSTWFEADVREHSRKPDRLYEIIEQTSPGAKLEMFAREPREGWQTWGAEAEKFAAAGAA
jgi:N6-adenosine-specific RNA methylase IME4